MKVKHQKTAVRVDPITRNSDPSTYPTRLSSALIAFARSAYARSMQASTVSVSRAVSPSFRSRVVTLLALSSSLFARTIYSRTLSFAMVATSLPVDREHV